jgi:hypothetical protein
MSLETENGFAKLERSRGDDRRFILRHATCG